MVPWHLTAVQCRNGMARGRVALQMVIMAWKAWYQEMVIGCLEQQVQSVPETGEYRPTSIWQMRKAELVEPAVMELGWPRRQAEAETVGQLRLALRERKAEQKAARVLTSPQSVLPKGLNRMKRVQLQEEATTRHIEVTRADGRRKTKEELIRDVRRHAAEVGVESEWILPPDPGRDSPGPRRESTGTSSEDSPETAPYTGRAESGTGSADGLTSRTALAAMRARRQPAGRNGTAVSGTDA